MSKPLGVAVIGTGFIGPVHIEAIRRAGAVVVGVLGSSLEKSRACAQRMCVPRAYENMQELLADASVQVVHVASPNRAHFEQVRECLSAGKHVLCEKPLAMNARESARLLELARATELVCGVNYNIRYYPLCIEARARRSAGQLGDVFHVTGSYAQDWLFHATDFNWRVLSDQGGPLRAVAESGAHWLDLVESITGLVVEAVCADLQTVHATRHCPVGGRETFSGQSNPQHDSSTKSIDTDDYGAILLRFRGGARGVLWVSQVTAGHKNCLRFEISGSQQSLAWNSESPDRLWIGHRDQPNQLLTRDPALLSTEAAQFTSYPGGHNEGFADSFKQLFVDFYRAIADRGLRSQPTFPTFDDGHREILICEAILQSARQNRWVEVGV